MHYNIFSPNPPEYPPPAIRPSAISVRIMSFALTIHITINNAYDFNTLYQYNSLNK